MDEKVLNALLDLLEEWGLTNLSYLICNRYGLRSRILKGLIQEAVKYSIVAGTDSTYHRRRFFSMKGLASTSEQRRITTLMFRELLDKIDARHLKMGGFFNQNHFQALYLLGYIRQCLPLLEYDQKTDILLFLGDIELYGSIYADSRIEDPFKKESFFRTALKADPFGKLELACREEFYEEKMLKCAVYHLMIFGFWEIFEDLDKTASTQKSLLESFQIESISNLKKSSEVVPTPLENTLPSKLPFFSRTILLLTNCALDT